jgi:hypothetical protein
MALSAIRSAHRRAIRIGRLQDFLGLGKDAINKVQLSRVLREFIALAEKDRHTFGRVNPCTAGRCGRTDRKS